MAKEDKEDKILFPQAREEMAIDKQYEIYSYFYAHLGALDEGIKEFSKYYIKKFEKKMNPLPEFFDESLLKELDGLQEKIAIEVSKFEQWIYEKQINQNEDD